MDCFVVSEAFVAVLLSVVIVVSLSFELDSTEDLVVVEDCCCASEVCELEEYSVLDVF